ncbi:glycogen synthase GlgA [Paenibacillus sp. N1-5-1-14]|uniref:glycogen synthase GlgA n=1 Tax=Paenibacillus radicibacter TaxID=2972488 RepID=UPI0021596D1B|nr:glycogen synthase GlgA [Paenibacillus radicibacter]MCR8641672.1 glycogen synthase GlgA [Paenibacillus radicibacter]
MNILHAASEVVPFAKTGGLGDVLGSLPQALHKQGADVRVIMPLYENIPRVLLKEARKIAEFTVQVGWRSQYCGIWEVHKDEVIYYLVDNEQYFLRSGLYGYEDDAERFAFFNRAVIEAIPRIDFDPDVIHVHDWQAAMIPVLLKTQYAHEPAYQGIQTVITVHNLKYQGTFSKDIMMDVFGLGFDFFNGLQLEMDGGGSFLKGGLLYADKITTVSKSYAQEIQTPFYGEQMDSLLRYRSHDLSGIVNGIDYDLYDPMQDPHLFMRYRDALSKKRQNKLVLQERLGLPQSDDVPVIALVTRMVQQKGLDLIAHVLPELMQLGAQWVVVGTGDEPYERMFRHASEQYPDKIAAQLVFDDALARQAYAASDLFLMPSLFEPCGIGQLIAMRYRSVPIVRETGGLQDTVQPYNEFTGEGTGFTFANYNAHDMLYTINRAIDMYQYDHQAWGNMLVNMKKNDYSWRKSALKYMDLYEQLHKQAAVAV